MLSIFPTMFLSLLAHAILRIFVGSTFLYLGVRHLKRDRPALKEVLTIHWPKLAGFFSLYIALVEVAVGLMFIAGFLTQIAAIVGGLFALKMLFFRKRFVPPVFPQPLLYVLLLGTCISLFITGAGILAIDLPV